MVYLCGHAKRAHLALVPDTAKHRGEMKVSQARQKEEGRGVSTTQSRHITWWLEARHVLALHVLVLVLVLVSVAVVFMVI